MVTNKKSKVAADGIHLGFSIFEILLNIKRFCWKQLENIILYVKIHYSPLQF